MPVFTAGHGARPAEELVELLTEAGVRTLVDVRRFPASRRHPRFNQVALAELLHARGHDVVHLLKPGHSDRSPAVGADLGDARRQALPLR